MGGLALKLAPKERVLINGVIVENGPRRAQLLIKTDNASVLRLRDALDTADVIGPASEAYYAAQRCVAGEITPDDASALITPLLPKLATLDSREASSGAVQNVEQSLDGSNLYRVMRCLRPLVKKERENEDIPADALD